MHRCSSCAMRSLSSAVDSSSESIVIVVVLKTPSDTETTQCCSRIDVAGLFLLHGCMVGGSMLQQSILSSLR